MRKSQARHVTLYVPDLFPAWLGNALKQESSIPRLPEIELLLARARQTGVSDSDVHRNLFNRFFVDVEPDEDLPIAALSCATESDLSTTDWFLCATPVHLRPDRDHLILLGSEPLAISQQEADELIALLNTSLSDDTWTLYKMTESRWFIRFKNKVKSHTHSINDVVGRSINDYLPCGADKNVLHTLANEFQMVMHSSDVNAARRASGKITVNSVWMWGGGCLPIIKKAATDMNISEVWSDNPIASGLARIGDIPLHSLPKSAHDWLAQAHHAGDQLLCWDSQIQEPGVDGLDKWVTFLVNFEENWIAPLLQELKRGQLDSLTLEMYDGRLFSITDAYLRRWWKRPRPIVKYLTSVAENK